MVLSETRKSNVPAGAVLLVLSLAILKILPFIAHPFLVGDGVFGPFHSAQELPGV